MESVLEAALVVAHFTTLFLFQFFLPKFFHRSFLIRLLPLLSSLPLSFLFPGLRETVEGVGDGLSVAVEGENATRDRRRLGASAAIGGSMRSRRVV